MFRRVFKYLSYLQLSFFFCKYLADSKIDKLSRPENVKFVRSNKSAESKAIVYTRAGISSFVRNITTRYNTEVYSNRMKAETH